jgi:uracil-DNA glycosylase
VGGFYFSFLNYIDGNYPSITWFLWGNHAEEATSKLQIKKAVRTLHPMMCYNTPGRSNDFLYGTINGFQLLQDEIDWTGFGGRKNWVASGTLF